jgi:hypothetical protein
MEATNTVAEQAVMAAIDLLKGWFERDLKFATWDANVHVDDRDPNKTDVHFYTDTNEYTLTLIPAGDDQAFVDATVTSRKARAGQSVARRRRLLPPGRTRLSERLWRSLLAMVVGLELVRVQRRAGPGDSDETEEHVSGHVGAESARC